MIRIAEKKPLKKNKEIFAVLTIGFDLFSLPFEFLAEESHHGHGRNEWDLLGSV